LDVGVQGSGGAIANCKLQIANFKLANSSFILRPSSLIPHPSSLSLRHSAFTLIELLATITIISILAGISLGALHYARLSAADAKTKATIAKLNALVMQRYESYMTRRVPIDLSDLIAKKTITAKQAVQYRYLALLDLMRMEMPERTIDITNAQTGTNPPLGLIQPTNPWTARPALSQMYLQKFNNSQKHNPPWPINNCRPAKYLYMWISMTYPEAMSQFDENEIKDLDGDHWPVFIDGWGNPIMFLRWAPGFLPPDSEIQTGDPVNDHDPFDSRRIFPGNYRLIPLIFSAGPDQAGHDVNNDKKYGIVSEFGNSQKYYNIGFFNSPLTDTLDDLDPYYSNSGKIIGSVTLPTDPDPGVNHFDNIHNHRIEQQ
jgi:prepilin-type N-terminal cleavage/methylation domain-containing protein